MLDYLHVRFLCYRACTWRSIVLNMRARRHQYKGGKQGLSLPQRPLLAVAGGNRDLYTRNARHTAFRNGDDSTLYL